VPLYHPYSPIGLRGLLRGWLYRFITLTWCYWPTVEYVDADAGGMRVGRHAGVVARIVLVRFAHDQFAEVASMSYPDPSA
jgi:hypothetical protein